MDNAKIHMCRELEEVVHACGAILLFFVSVLPVIKPDRGSFWYAEKVDPTTRKPRVCSRLRNGAEGGDARVREAR